MGSHYNEVTPRALNKRPKKVKTSTPPQQNPPLDGSDWPPSLQNFANRSFLLAKSLGEPVKTQVGMEMQQLMQMAISQEKIWTNQWHLQQLPALCPGIPLDLVQNQVPVQVHQNTQHNSQHVPQPEPISVPAKRLNGSYDSDERKLKRMARFQNSNRKTPLPSPAPTNGPVKGYLTALEKRYLRLTLEPDPSVVRPERVLEQSLDFVMNKYRTENPGYLYINDQLKAIRQDLTVQHIKNELSIKVYKTHGRLAIINNDLGEFNQCSSQLKQLYSSTSNIQDTYEFMCYRVLYLLLTGNFSEVNVILLNLIKIDLGSIDLDEEHKTYRDGLYSALDLLTSIKMSEYHHFFKTYKQFREVKLLAYAFHLMKHSMATKQRLLALNIMCKAYKKLPILFLELELGFDEEEDISEFLEGHNLAQFSQNSDFDCALARPVVQGIVDKGNFRKVDIKGQV